MAFRPKASTSRAPTRAAPKAGIKLDAPLLDAQRQMAEYQREEDECPICLSTRYLKPTLRLLVSRTCYHIMCESCIDRNFSSGPGPCPTCSTMIRKASFAPQRFEDLGVEKEVTIRQKIASCFNKRQEDFDSLRDYNNYLEEVEDITFNLIHQVDVAATEERIKAYRKANQSLIETNAQRDVSDSKAAAARAAAERERAQAERERYAAIDAQLEAERDAAERDLMRTLAVAGGDAEVTKAAVARARRAAQARAEAAERAATDVTHLMGGGMSSRMPGEDEVVFEPEDPLGDVDRYDDCMVMFDLPEASEGYPSDRWTDILAGDKRVQAGGWERPAYWGRCVRSAVQGLFAPLPAAGLVA